MGTHISRVKSVDLDAWTDEQLQSVLKWGNSRANKYWEAKLAPGHVPSEAKIENFIRTKYESKRWVMDGPMPDPATLDADGDDDIPLNLVKEKHNLERSSSMKGPTSTAQASGPSSVTRAKQPDLFGDVAEPTASRRAQTTSPPLSRPAPKAEAAPPKQTKPADSLLGLDFFGAEGPPPNRPASAAAVAGTATQSRPDLKQSILSLYATAPRPQPQQQTSHSSQPSFGGIQAPTNRKTKSSTGGLDDAFSSLSFGGPTSPTMQSPAAKTSAFAGLGNVSAHRSTPSQGASASNFGTGSFFDSKPAQKTQPLGDLFDFSSPATTKAMPKQAMASPPPQSTSVFNLSAPQPPPPQSQTKPQTTGLSGWNNTDAWGSNDAWSSTSAAPAKVSPPIGKPEPLKQTSSSAFGWASSGSLAGQSIVPGGGGGFTPASSAPPKVSADEDFGGWSTAAPVTPGAGTSATKPATGFAASEDLFSNVWE
jgi:stromal membrane-associated protein